MQQLQKRGMVSGGARASAGMIVAACAGVAVAATPTSASACHETTVCFVYYVGFQDNDVGEDIAADSVIPASGANVTIVRTAPEEPIATFLEPNGCVTFETQFAYGHKAIIYSDATVGGARIRASLTQSMDFDVPLEYEPYLWEVHLHGLAEGDQTTVPILQESGLDPLDPKARMLPMFASATATLQRFVDLGIMPDIAPGTELGLVYRPDLLNARCYCNGDGQDRLELGPDSFREKFVMAHELGHWLQRAWSSGSTMSGGYFFENEAGHTVEEPCRFFVEPFVEIDDSVVDNADAESHGLRSAEWSSAALGEGYAQFVASVTWNEPNTEDGVFRYYKDIDVNKVPAYEDFVDMGNLVSLKGGDEDALGGRSAWVKNECPDDWNYANPAIAGDEEIGSEIDWMRFFWRFATDDATAAPTLAQVFQLVAYIQDEDPWTPRQVWPSFLEGVDNAPGMNGFAARLAALAAEEGVDGD